MSVKEVDAGLRYSTQDARHSGVSNKSTRFKGWR